MQAKGAKVTHTHRRTHLICKVKTVSYLKRIYKSTWHLLCHFIENRWEKAGRLAGWFTCTVLKQKAHNKNWKKRKTVPHIWTIWALEARQQRQRLVVTMKIFSICNIGNTKQQQGLPVSMCLLLLLVSNAANTGFSKNDGVGAAKSTLQLMKNENFNIPESFFFGFCYDKLF